MNNVMVKQSLQYLLLVLCCIMVWGCVKVDVESPQRNAIYTEAPDEFLIQWSSDIVDPVLTAHLNGVDVSDLFLVIDGHASVQGSTLKDYLRHGNNLLKITSPGHKVVPFVMDLEGPEVHITQVTSVGFPLIQVDGYVKDPSTVTRLQYADMTGHYQDAELTDNQFSILLNQGLSGSWDFIATDSADQKSSMVYKRPIQDKGRKTWFANSVGLRVNMSGLDFASGIGNDILNNEDLDILTLIKNANPLINETILGIRYKVYLDHADINLNTLSIVPSAMPDKDLDIMTSALVQNAKLTLCTQTVLFNEPPLCVIKTTIASVKVNADFAIDLKGELTTVSVPPDGIQIRSVQLRDLDVNNPVFNAIIAIVTDVVELFNSAIELIFKVDVISDIAELIVTPIAQDVLQQMLITISMNYDMGPQGKRNLDALAGFNKIYRDGQSLIVQLNSKMETSTPAAVVDPLGVRDSGQAPVPPAVSPLGHLYDFSMALSTSFINQLLDMSYRAGYFTMTIDNPSSGPYEAIRVKTIPISAPYITTGTNTEPTGRLRINDFSVIIQVQKPNTDEFTDYIAVTIEVDAPFELISLTQEQRLGLAVSPLVNLEIVDVKILGNAPLITTGGYDAILDRIEPIIMPSISNLMNNILGSVELPTVLGLSVSPREMWVDPKANSFMVAGELVAKP